MTADEALKLLFERCGYPSLTEDDMDWDLIEEKWRCIADAAEIRFVRSPYGGGMLLMKQVFSGNAYYYVGLYMNSSRTLPVMVEIGREMYSALLSLLEEMPRSDFELDEIAQAQDIITALGGT